MFRPRLMAVTAVVLALGVPCLIVALSRHTFALGDIALIELRTRDVLSAHPPLVGAYSRYGWSHPGPLAFYLLAIPYRLLGGDYAALRVSALLVNVLAIVAIVWVARLRGKAVFVVLLAAVCLLVWGMEPISLTDSWNVTIAVVPFMFVLVACWCALCGDKWAWVAAAAGFSFVFQAHIGFGVVLVPVVAATGLFLVWARRRDPGVISVRTLLVGTGVALVLALPVLYDVIAHWPGNLGRLIDWSFSSGEATIGVPDALRLVGRATSLSFPLHAELPKQFVFATGGVDHGLVPGVLLVMVLAAMVVAVRRQMRAEALLCGVVLATWVSGFFATTRVTRPLFFWLVQWMQPLAWLTWAAVAIVAWRCVQPLVVRCRSASLVAAIGSGVAAVVLVGGTLAYARGAAGADRDDSSVAPITTFVEAASSLDRSQPIHIAYEGDPFATGTVFLAVANQLDRAGFDLCVDADVEHQFGGHRVCDGRADMQLLIRGESTALPPPDGATLLAISDPLSRSERIEADTITASLNDILLRNDLSDREPLLYTQFVSLILDDSPPEELIDARADIERLEQLRHITGTRLGLYEVRPES